MLCSPLERPRARRSRSYYSGQSVTRRDPLFVIHHAIPSAEKEEEDKWRKSEKDDGGDGGGRCRRCWDAEN